MFAELTWTVSGGATAAKDPGHFEVRTSSSQVTWMHFFSRCPQNTKAANAAEIFFTVKIKQIKRSAVRYGKIFIFCSHYYWSKAKQYAGRSQGGGSSSQVIWPSTPWCSASTVDSETCVCIECVSVQVLRDWCSFQSLCRRLLMMSGWKFIGCRKKCGWKSWNRCSRCWNSLRHQTLKKSRLRWVSSLFHLVSFTSVIMHICGFVEVHK